MTLLIKNGLVLKGSPLRSDFERADLLIEDGAIAGILPPGAHPPGAVDEVIDAADCFVLPGFVDTHHHLWESTMRGMVAEWSLTDFMWGVRTQYAKRHTPDAVYAGTYAGAVSCIDAGITTALEHFHMAASPDHARSSLQAVAESGLRSLWAYGLNLLTPETGFTDTRQIIGDISALMRNFSTTYPDTITLGAAPNELFSVPWQQTIQEFSFAKDQGLAVTAHANCFRFPEAPKEISLLKKYGLLFENQIFSHMNGSDEQELERLAEVGAKVAVTPESELQMALGFPIWNKAKKAGVRVGLGTDTQGSAPPDAFRWMNLALRSSAAFEQEETLNSIGLGGIGPRPLSLREALHAATLGGAEVLGLSDKIGSINIGKRADIILVRYNRVYHQPVIDPFATIVLYCSPRDVETVLIDGKILKRSGALAGGREEKALQLIATKARTVLEYVGEPSNMFLAPPPPADFADQIRREIIKNSTSIS